jgi:uncharacterized protein (TIGR03067 family)
MHCAAIVFLLFSVSAADVPAEAAKDLAKLQGIWKDVGGEEAGLVQTAEDAKKEQIAFSFKRGTLVVTRKDETLAEFEITVRPGKDWGEIDLKHKGGKYDGKTCHGIYVLDGEKLKIRTASKMRSDEATDRPNVFSTKKSSKPSDKPGLLLFLLEREK